MEMSQQNEHERMRGPVPRESSAMRARCTDSRERGCSRARGTTRPSESARTPTSCAAQLHEVLVGELARGERDFVLLAAVLNDWLTITLRDLRGLP